MTTIIIYSKFSTLLNLIKYSCLLIDNLNYQIKNNILYDLLYLCINLLLIFKYKKIQFILLIKKSNDALGEV